MKYMFSYPLWYVITKQRRKTLWFHFSSYPCPHGQRPSVWSSFMLREWPDRLVAPCAWRKLLKRFLMSTLQTLTTKRNDLWCKQTGKGALLKEKSALFKRLNRSAIKLWSNPIKRSNLQRILTAADTDFTCLEWFFGVCLGLALTQAGTEIPSSSL